MIRVMTFVPGDFVHVTTLGKGTVREVRSGGRYLVDIKGRALVVAGSHLTRAEPPTRPRRDRASAASAEAPGARDLAAAPASLDLHGMTVHEALDALGAFLNAALLDGHADVRIIHGRSGGKLKGAVHEMLKGMPSVRGFRLDRQNPGVTIVSL